MGHIMRKGCYNTYELGLNETLVQLKSDQSLTKVFGRVLKTYSKDESDPRAGTHYNPKATSYTTLAPIQRARISLCILGTFLFNTLVSNPGAIQSTDQNPNWADAAFLGKKRNRNVYENKNRFLKKKIGKSNFNLYVVDKTK